MSWGPLPSQLCLLSSLRDRPVGDKVRFLGCVTSYSTSRGCLVLGHVCPPGTNEYVCVEIGLLLETIRSECARVGEWVNVVGYITDKSDPADTKTSEMEGEGVAKMKTGGESCVSIQALLVWPTGPLDIGRYERSLLEGQPALGM